MSAVNVKAIEEFYKGKDEGQAASRSGGLSGLLNLSEVKMRKSFLIISLVTLSLVFSCAIVALAQGRPPIVGGYREVPTDSAEVQEAAEFAVGAQAKKQDIEVKLLSVEHAESQVVAGMNFRMCLKVEVEDKANNVDVTQEVKVVVYRNLKKEFSLTSWEEEDCSESK